MFCLLCKPHSPGKCGHLAVIESSSRNLWVISHVCPLISGHLPSLYFPFPLLHTLLFLQMHIFPLLPQYLCLHPFISSLEFPFLFINPSFTTRLTVNGFKLDQLPEAKVLGVWLTKDLTWSKNTKQICKNAYPCISMITKRKYVGVIIEDLLDIYVQEST